MSAGVSEALSRQRRQAATMRQEASQLRHVVGPMDPSGTSPMTSLPLSSAHFLGALPDPAEQSSANVLPKQTQELVRHSEWPVAMSLVSQQVSTSSSLVDRIKCTQRDFSYIARERRSFGRVQYVQGCKGLCDNAHGAGLKRIQTTIVAKLEWLLKQAKASQALLRCTVGAATTWWQVVSWTSSAGLTEFRAAVVLCFSLPHDEARLLCDATAWEPPIICIFLRMNRLQGDHFSFNTFDHACSRAGI